MKINKESEKIRKPNFDTEMRENTWTKGWMMEGS
jgi:hypothetical protein